MGEVVKGIDLNAPKQIHNQTIKLFIEKEYKPWIEVHRKDAIKTLARINRCFSKPYSNKLLSEFSTVFIDQWRTQRLKMGCAIETVNVDVATFKAALSKAVEWGFIDVHPLAKLKSLKSDSLVKVRYLDEDEEQRLREAIDRREEKLRVSRAQANEWRKERDCELLPVPNSEQYFDYIKPMILLSINTGLRQGELFVLKWENINFTVKTITIEGKIAKSNRTRHVPLNDEALDVLMRWRKTINSQGLIFQNRAGEEFDSVKKAWNNLLKAAKIGNFRWHDMRHHFASRLVMVGVDLNTVRELLGHSDIKMTLRYAHLAPEHKADAVSKLIRNPISKIREIHLESSIEH